MPEVYRAPCDFVDLTSTGGAVYGTKGKIAVTAVGSTGQVLTSNGTAPPTWETPTTPSTASSAVFFFSG
jgi:hypothetical protein